MRRRDIDLMFTTDHSPPPLDSCLRRNDVRTGDTTFGMLRSTLGRVTAGSDACEVSTRSRGICVVTTHNGDQEV